MYFKCTVYDRLSPRDSPGYTLIQVAMGCRCGRADYNGLPQGEIELDSL